MKYKHLLNKQGQAILDTVLAHRHYYKLLGFTVVSIEKAPNMYNLKLLTPFDISIEGDNVALIEVMYI